ncbi:MAG TPA: hypothetical protein VJ984_07190 [Xanthomonadales bacterium]|nr:hypothetical protein [Xanthomonadales bacterium]
MHKGSVATLVGVVVVIGALVAAEYYFFEHRPRAAEAALGNPDYSAGLPDTSNLAGDDTRIIECEDPDVGKFYTDAENCEDAEPPDPNQPPPP